MYGLSLSFAAALLYTLPVAGGTALLQSDVEGYTVVYLQMLAIDLTILVLFIHGSLLMKDKYLPLIIRRKMSQPQQTRLISGLWNLAVAGLVASSICSFLYF